MTETNQTTEEELEQEDKTTEAADTTEYTIDKQMLDQERANTRRAREELASVSELYESSNERVEQLEKELDEIKSSYEQEKARLEAAQQTEQDKLDDMDPDVVDPQVIKNIQAIERRLERQRQEHQKEKADLLSKLSDLTKKAAQYEQEKADLQRKTEHEKAVESVLNRVEASLKRQNVATPGQYRTEAIKLADELVDKGERKKPANIIEGVDLMEECYLQVISRHQKKKNVSVDGGKSGVTTGVKQKGERKTGSLSEVKADMLKDKSWKED